MYQYYLYVHLNVWKPLTGKYRLAENVIRDCIDNKMELDTVAYNTFIKAMLDAGYNIFPSFQILYLVTNLGEEKVGLTHGEI